MTTPDPIQPPTYLGMVICDNVLQDPENKKYFLMGTATVTYAPSFPVRQHKLCVYAALTGMTGVQMTDLRPDATWLFGGKLLGRGLLCAGLANIGLKSLFN